MLNPKELMLGNWVYESERSQFPMKVVNIDKDMVYLDFEGNEGGIFDGRMEDICPIPLTEEMLLKNEFIKEQSSFQTQFYENFPVGEDFVFVNLFSERGFFEMFFLDGFKEIKYVHQLQNIITIAGIEIDFKI